MNKCSECENIANWRCISCNILFCSTHKRTHNDDEQEHNIIKLKIKVPEDLKRKVLETVSSKTYLIDQFSNQIIKSTEIIVEQLNSLSKALLSTLEETKIKYQQILRLLNTEIVEDQLKAIENEVAAVLIYEKRGSIEDCRWYEQEIIKESSIACNRREECFTLGRDLIEEVLKNSLIYLERINVYASEVGAIKETNYIYHGEIENGLPHGRGECFYNSGSTYYGEFANGKLEGRGIYKWGEGEFKGDLYDGEWKAGKKEGRGVYKYASGDMYDGAFKNDLKEGKGVFKWFQGKFKGDLYDGEWKIDLKEGRGVYKSASGEVYDGEYKAGKREGRGIYKSVSGDVYDGEYKAGKREGRGFYKSASGNEYNGEWKNGLKEGRGVCKYASGDAYDGEFKFGKAEGRGVYVYASGDIYDGAIKNDLKEGRGVYKYASGEVYDGEFKAGKAMI